MANPIVFDGGLKASPQSIYEVHSVSHDAGARANGYHPIGTRGWLPDGRAYRYARSGTSAALTRGQLHVEPEVVANHLDLACVATSGAVGSFVVSGVTIGATALTENQYQDGLLVVTDGAGEAIEYKIRGHAAFSASATTVAITLYDPIAVALDATSTVSLIYDSYDRPQLSAVDQSDVLVGVPTFTITQSTTTTTYFGWVQTWGKCPVLCDEAIATVGQAITIGTGVTGAAEEDDTATTVSQEPIVGYNITPFVDTEYQVVMLRVAP
jgi:hypothetical protein